MARRHHLLNFRQASALHYIFAAALFIIQTTTATAQPPELKIAALVELSGPTAVVGEEVRRGLEVGKAMYVDQRRSGAMRLNLIYGDTRDDPKAAVSEFRRLVEVEKVDAVIVSRSKIAMPVNPLAAQLGVPVIGAVGHPDFIRQNPGALRLFPSADEEGRFLADAAIDRGKKKAAVLTLDDEWTLQLSKVFAAQFVKRGGEVVSNQIIDPAETDLASVALNVKAASPDMVFADLLLTQLGPMAKRLREQKVDQQILSNYWIQRQDVINAGGPAIEGVLFDQVDTERKNFKAELIARYPDTTTLVAPYLAHLAVALVCDAFERSGYDRAKFKQALLETSEFPSADSTEKIVGRETRFPLVMRVIRDGRVAEP